MLGNRLKILFVVLLIVIVSAVGGWIGGSTIISPAEAAARTAPPIPSPILVPIEERILTSDIVTRGTARFGLAQDITIVPSALRLGNNRVTSLPEQGSELNEGDVLLTVSGRPVFILQGVEPVYRDLLPGLVGSDVLQLEQALQRLGFDPGTIDTVFDERTSEAIAAWYATTEWDSSTPSEEQIAQIRRLEQELIEVNNRRVATENNLALMPSTIEIAHANAESANLRAESDVIRMRSIRDEMVANPNSSVDDRAIASAELEAAIAAQTAIQIEGEIMVQEVINLQNLAEEELVILNNLINQITTDLHTAEQALGVWIPASEIVFVSNLPVRVDELKVVVGDWIEGSIMTLTNNQLAIDSSLPLDEAPLVSMGMEVLIDETNLGVSATGIVSKVADNPGTSGVDGFHIYFEVVVDETPHELDGFSLRLTIPIETTGEAVMVVPISALSLATDGSSRLQIEVNGQLEFITVEPGLAADGFVEVTPLDGSLQLGQMVVIGFELQS